MQVILLFQKYSEHISAYSGACKLHTCVQTEFLTDILLTVFKCFQTADDVDDAVWTVDNGFHCEELWSQKASQTNSTLGDFTFWISLSLSLKTESKD